MLASDVMFQMKDFKNGDKFSPFLYDAMMLYAISLNESVAKGLDPRSGVALALQMKNKVFEGMRVVHKR